MSVSVEVKTVIRGGLPLIAEASFICYDRGDLELDTLDLYTLRGKKADWAKPTKADLDRIEVECLEALMKQGQDAEEHLAELRAEDKRWFDY